MPFASPVTGLPSPSIMMKVCSSVPGDPGVATVCGTSCRPNAMLQLASTTTSTAVMSGPAPTSPLASLKERDVGVEEEQAAELGAACSAAQKATTTRTAAPRTNTSLNISTAT